MADNINDLNQEKQINEDILDVSNRLVASLRDRKKLGADIGENEKLLFSISKQLQSTSLTLTSSLEKRNNLTIKSKDLSKEISKLEDADIDDLEEGWNLIDKYYGNVVRGEIYKRKKKLYIPNVSAIFPKKGDS